MGNEDGFMSAMVNQGTNTVQNINKKAYFSFAFGNEIALVLDGSYYILNCDSDLWDKVIAKLKETKSLTKIKKWWYKQSKTNNISEWSGYFKELK